MKSPTAALALLLAFCAACQKQEPTATQPPPPIETASASSTNLAGASGAAAVDPSAVLSDLTQKLRKFSAENQRVPKTLQELVTAGYISSIPAAPPGKKFAINEKRVEVVLE